jgi:hypothetical protein
MDEYNDDDDMDACFIAGSVRLLRYRNRSRTSMIAACEDIWLKG